MKDFLTLLGRSGKKKIYLFFAKETKDEGKKRKKDVVQLPFYTFFSLAFLYVAQ